MKQMYPGAKAFKRTGKSGVDTNQFNLTGVALGERVVNLNRQRVVNLNQQRVVNLNRQRVVNLNRQRVVSLNRQRVVSLKRSAWFLKVICITTKGMLCIDSDQFNFTRGIHRQVDTDVADKVDVRTDTDSFTQIKTHQIRDCKQ